MNIELLEKHLDALGCRAKDKVTGYEGVIDSVAYDLYGCIQYVIKPPVDKDGKVPSGFWFDVSRLEIGERVIDLPRFDLAYVAQGKKGAADKPIL